MLKMHSDLQFQRITPLNPLQRHPNMHAVASAEQSAAFVLFQRHQVSLPPHKIVNSVDTAVLAAVQFGGNIAVFDDYNHLTL